MDSGVAVRVAAGSRLYQADFHGLHVVKAVLAAVKLLQAFVGGQVVVGVVQAVGVFFEQGDGLFVLALANEYIRLHQFLRKGALIFGAHVFGIGFAQQVEVNRRRAAVTLCHTFFFRLEAVEFGKQGVVHVDVGEFAVVDVELGGVNGFGGRRVEPGEVKQRQRQQGGKNEAAQYDDDVHNDRRAIGAARAVVKV